jgi:predicted NAD-dependent protein-ADP-ribosyltransferase YbiA (DUF1768 family)
MRYQRHDRAGAGEGAVLAAQSPGPAPALDRARLAHLARDWDARAAQLERASRGITGMDWMRARELRICAEQLRNLLGLPAEHEQEGNG